MESDEKPKKKLSLSAQIMIAMGLGILAGVFFGDYCGFLEIFGEAFIKLLQMTILPYITISMILGIGSLTSEQAKLMAKKAGMLMLIFWGLPFDALDSLTGTLDGGPEMFLLSGVSLVAAAVWVVMYNADVIVWAVSKMIGRFGSLRPVVKMAIAYPMAARFRTGLTLAMFSLVIFTMMIFAILTNLGNAIEDEPELVSGGFDIRSTIDAELPINDVDAVIAASGGKLLASDFEVITQQASLRIEARQDGAEDLGCRLFTFSCLFGRHRHHAGFGADLQLGVEFEGSAGDDVFAFFKAALDYIVIA